MRSELIDSVNILINFVIVSREEADSAFNQCEFIAVDVQLCRAENGVSEVVNESIVGVVGFGTVDDNGLEILVPRLRFAEEFEQGAFTLDRILSKAFDELFGNVFVNVVGIRMAEIIIKRSPDVIAQLFFKFVHKWIPRIIKVVVISVPLQGRDTIQMMLWISCSTFHLMAFWRF